jgi:hypothetical protein
MWLRPSRASVDRTKSMNLRSEIVSLAILVLLAGCSAPKATAPVDHISMDDALATATRVADCEWSAADKYDDGRSSLSALAEQVMGVCTRERFAMRRAAGFAPMDPTLDADELRQAIENVESARKHRKNSN